MSSFLFYLRSDKYIKDIFNGTNIRSWEDFKEHLLSRLGALRRCDKLIFYYYDNENNRIVFRYDVDYQNAMKIPDCKISFGIPMNVIVSSKDKEKKVQGIMDYYSDTGCDEHFFHSLYLKRNNYAKSLKNQAINIIPYLVGEDDNHIELRTTIDEHNIIIYCCSSIFLGKPKGYSDFVLEDVSTRFQWPTVLHNENDQLILEAIWEGKYSSSSLNDKINDDDVNSSVSFPDNEMLTTTIKSLKYFRNVIDDEDNNCYSEANRRIIINILLLAGLQSGDRNKVSLCAEKNMKLITSRIGNGPLDYYIVNSGQQIITALPHKQTEKEEEDEVDNDKNDNVEENYRGISILEAKTDIDAADLGKGLPQLLAQMLDALNISNNSRKRSADVLIENEVTTTSSSGGRLSATNQVSSTIKEKKNKKNIVKGMLSTGHHTMFFSLSRLSDAEELPMIVYYGKYSIDVLSKKTNRDSGLAEDEDIDSNKVRRMLRAIHCFVKNDFE